MSSFFVLNSYVAPALPLWGRGSDGRPTVFKFWEYLAPAGATATVKEGIADSVCECPDDNGDSWTAESARDVARGTHIYLEVVGKVNMKEAVERLRACKANQKRVQELLAGGPTHGEPEPTPVQPIDTRPEWQRLDFPSKAEWRAWVAAGKPAR